MPAAYPSNQEREDGFLAMGFSERKGGERKKRDCSRITLSYTNTVMRIESIGTVSLVYTETLYRRDTLGKGKGGGAQYDRNEKDGAQSNRTNIGRGGDDRASPYEELATLLNRLQRDLGRLEHGRSTLGFVSGPDVFSDYTLDDVGWISQRTADRNATWEEVLSDEEIDRLFRSLKKVLFTAVLGRAHLTLTLRGSLDSGIPRVVMFLAYLSYDIWRHS
jgi:hypothetical protein